MPKIRPIGAALSGPARPWTWAWVIRLCKQQPSYAVVQDDGLEIHTVGADHPVLALERR